MIHALRLRRATFESIAPGPPTAFEAWWRGEPRPAGTSTSLVIVDLLPGERSSKRRFVGLDDANTVKPRYRGYADAAEALRRVGLV